MLRATRTSLPCGRLLADLNLRRLQLAGRHVTGALGIVELGRAVETLGDQFADPLVLALGLAGVGFGLAQCLFGQWQAGFADLAQAAFGLGQAGPRLSDTGLPFGGVELEQHLAGGDGVALAHGDGGHPAGDLAGYFDPLRGAHPTAGHHRLAQFAAFDTGDLDPIAAQAEVGDGSQGGGAEAAGQRRGRGRRARVPVMRSR